MTNRNTFFYINGLVHVKTLNGRVPLPEEDQVIKRSPQAAERSRRLNMAEREKLMAHFRAKLPAADIATGLAGA